ncbi:N-succinylarginine dihydrolase [Pseudomonas matsuisoli]|uniref:N-succinylarginine dihydrolase n=1 Tax=Pseudomonas matsuisoli TaxID=1515666 RepID=A0A917PU15_9PSED|nr:N-succinylarginine dihydrolase [Pseudomonas matsuisoli]GGJ91298.1 N-succinylarginine dihydrolase [Pseudomonas matsuisoli]
MSAYEVNFDGLVGPTHNYGGLSLGNVASQSNGQVASNPREAAKQGLAKMKALMDRGFCQGVIPPQERPDIRALKGLGFSGSDAQVLDSAARTSMPLLVACSSASSMWTANACTVSPSADTRDGRVHFTVANLNSKFHRSIEPPATSALLKAMFPDERYFAHHGALPAVPHFGDEGAANHSRLHAGVGSRGIEFFVFGKSAFDTRYRQPALYPARQTLEASRAVMRLHGLDPRYVVFAQQNPDVVDHGVFHNDVIAVANGEVLFFHEDAYIAPERVLDELAEKLRHVGGTLRPIMVRRSDVCIDDAVQSYLFNSQLLTHADGTMLLVVPEECRQNTAVWRYLQKLAQSGGPIRELLVLDLKQSMRNGGGPACLRLRVELTDVERQAVNSGVLLTPTLHERLLRWVDTHYRDRLVDTDLADPSLLDECRTALDELTGLLGLGCPYPFQQG